MDTTDMNQNPWENINSESLKNEEVIWSVQKGFQSRILLWTLWLLHYTKELLGILPEKRHPSEIVEMLAKKRQEALSTLWDDEASNDSDFQKVA